jgi:hypothetical protein
MLAYRVIGFGFVAWLLADKESVLTGAKTVKIKVDSGSFLFETERKLIPRVPSS